MPRGFTLIELMIVMVIVAILAAIALPSYARFITKGNRDEARSSLQQIQLLQEAWRSDNGVYADGTDLAAQLTDLGEADKYQYSITTSGRTSYEAVATAVGQQASRETAQFGETTSCTQLTVTVNLAGVTREPLHCW